MKPTSLNLVAEIRLDWPKIINKVPIQFRGILNTKDIKRIGLVSEQFKHPIVVIEDQGYISLNKDAEFLTELTKAINSQLINKCGGVKFISPIVGKQSEFIDTIIEEFDAQIINVEEGQDGFRTKRAGNC